MRKIIISAPGKIHLIGEHTVVYGKSALISTIDLRVYVRINEAKKRSFSKGIKKIQGIIEPMVAKKLPIVKIPLHAVSITSGIPQGSGLGSSAAICAAYITALLEFLGTGRDKKLVNQLTYEAEKFFNGNPSGGDNTAIVYGGVMQFQKGKRFQYIRIPKNSDQFVLINSGRPKESTAEMVQKVASFARENIRTFKKVLHDQEKLTLRMRPVLEEGRHEELLEVIMRAQRNLERLGVVSEKARLLIRAIEQLGAAAKITGGGGIQNGSGMILCFGADVEKIMTFAKKQNLECIPVNLGTEGLRKEL